MEPTVKQIEQVVGKLQSQSIEIDAEWGVIEECLKATVCPEFCIAVAKFIRGKEFPNMYLLTLGI